MLKTVIKSFLILVSLVVLMNNLMIGSNPMISVVMSTYNRGDLLPRAIDSILSQTYANFEFIIINDGSTDETANILESYKKKDKRIKIITNTQNNGLVYSLNKGLNKARGKYIARMDDDDLSIPTRFEVQFNFMENHPDITVCGTTRFNVNIPEDKEEIQQKISKYVQASSFPNTINEFDTSDLAINSYYEVPIFHPSAFIRKKFLMDHDIQYRRIYESAEDTGLWFDITQNEGKIIRLRTPLVLRGSSNKKKNYYSDQLKNYNLFLERSLAGIYKRKGKGWLGHNEICEIFSSLKTQIGKKSFLTEKAIKHMENNYGCQRKNIYFFYAWNKNSLNECGGVIHPAFCDLKNDLSKTGFTLSQTTKDAFTLFSISPVNYTKSIVDKYPQKVIFLLETPSRHQDIQEINKFDIIFTYDQSKVDNKKYFHLMIPYTSKQKNTQKLQRVKKETFISMINSNITPKRKEIAKWFVQKHPEKIKLYGKNWKTLYNELSENDKHNFLKIDGGYISRKADAFSKSKYAIVFENNTGYGYISEKIFDAFFMGTVPIYWGAPDITDYIPKRCFINFNNFKSFDELYNYLNNMSDKEYKNYQQCILDYVKNFSDSPFSRESVKNKILSVLKDKKII